MYYSAHEVAVTSSKGSNLQMLVFVGIMLAGLFYVVPQALQSSQLAVPDDGPVKYRWMEKNGTHKCMVLNKDLPPLMCSQVAPAKLRELPLLWQKPNKRELKFGNRYE